MRRVTKWGGAFGGVLLASSLATGQPPVPVGPGGAGAGAAGGPAAAAPAVKAGVFARACDTLGACRRKICASPAGQLLNNMTRPVTALSGGTIPPFCPGIPTPADLAQPGVAGAADAIKKDALEAKMRREKVRFLGTVDCRFYPDATGALVAALRTDGSECVRYEAALALTRGCCCNQMTIAALDACVSGTDKDGNPEERSDRVRYAAAAALEHCLACYVPRPVEPDPGPKVDPREIGPKGSDKAPPPRETPGKLPPTDAGVTPASAKKVMPPELRAPTAKTVEEARRTLEQFKSLVPAGPRVAPPPVKAEPADRSSVLALVRNSGGTNAAVPMPVARTVPMPAGTPAASGEWPSFAGPNAASAPLAVSVSPAAPANPVAPVVIQLISGATPAERQTAARQLGKFDWRENLLVATGLIAGAKNDPSAPVRIDCVRQLATNQVVHPQVIAELKLVATRDADPTVRDEATKALGELKANP